MEAFSEVLTKSPIVIDNGSGSIKAGFSGEEKPKIHFNNYVGRPKYKPVLPNVKQQAYHIGNFKEENRGLLKLNYPMKNGIVQNWQDMDLVWKHVFQELKVNPNEYPIMLTEPALNPHRERAKLAQHFFENYSTPALFIGIQGVLSLFASGKTTGVVFECGDGVTQIVPVFEGYYLQHANQRIDLGGRDVTEQLRTLLRRSGFSFNTTAEWEIVKQIKEKKCLLIPTSQTYMEDKYSKFVENYILPDGTPIELVNEKNKAPEILFNPEKIGLEYPSVSELFTNCIQKTDIDLRRTLFQEVIISGGTTLLQGFPERFINEVKKLSNKDLKMKFFVPPNRNTLCWSGGAILSNLNYFKNMWILKKEYEEEGDRILLKKSF